MFVAAESPRKSLESPIVQSDEGAEVELGEIIGGRGGELPKFVQKGPNYCKKGGILATKNDIGGATPLPRSTFTPASMFAKFFEERYFLAINQYWDSSFFRRGY